MPCPAEGRKRRLEHPGTACRAPTNAPAPSHPPDAIMTDQKTRVAVGLGDGLPEVLNRLRKAAGSSVSLEIPDASSLFLTASEFRALQAAAEHDRIALSVTTDDPL